MLHPSVSVTPEAIFQFILVVSIDLFIPGFQQEDADDLGDRHDAFPGLRVAFPVCTEADGVRQTNAGGQTALSLNRRLKQ